MVSTETRRELASNGAALATVWGGPQKVRYYTPSGDEVWSIPALRDWVQKDDNGKVVAQGTRDANLDKGWSLSMPAELKLHCSGCDRWHDTEDELAACAEKRAAVAAAWERKAHKMQKNGAGAGVDSGTNDRLDVLEQGMERIEGLLLKALGEK